VAIALVGPWISMVGCGDAGSVRGLGADAPWSVASDETKALPLAERYAAALDETDPLDRHMRLAEVYASVRAEDMPALVEILKRDLRARRPEEVRVLANLLARLDSKGALEEVLSWSVPHARTFGQAEVLSVWAASGDFEAARETWRRLAADLPGTAVDQGELAMIEALATHRLMEPLLEILQECDDPEQRRRLIAKTSLVMSQTAGRDFPGWVEETYRKGIENEDLRAELILQVTKLYLLAGVEPALDWYERVKDASCSGDVLAVIGEKWARSDPKAALDFMNARSVEEHPEMGRRAVAFIWLQTSPAEAEPVLTEAIEKDPGMQSALLPLVQFKMVRRLPEAMEMAQRIQDDEERESILKQGLMRWVQLDPGAVDAYMASHPVTDEVKRAVQGARQLRQSRSGA